MLFPTTLLNKLTENDIIQIPWGFRPNVFCPTNAPAGPVIIINTPDGQQRLTFDGTNYVGDTYSINFDGTMWCLVGPDINQCFTAGNFACQEFPTGFSFVKSTGPSQDYEILKIDVEIDDCGRISHYVASVELDDKSKRLPIQQ